MHYPNYNSPPRQPFQLPISSHPPAASCGPGRTLADGAFVSRGGVFEGAAMAHGDEHCGYWSDHVGDVNLWQQGYPQHRPAPLYHTSRVRPYPPETRSHFQPRGVMLGFPKHSYPPNAMGAVPGAGRQPMDPMHMIVNRRRRVWTGPLNEQQDWPDMATPRGGVLDGNALAYHKHGMHSAFYGGASPRVLSPPEQIDVMANPLDQGPVPTVGWGVPGTPPDMQLAGMGEYYSAPGAGGVRQLRGGMGEYYTPAGIRSQYGAQEATRPAPIRRGDQVDSQIKAVCPKAVSSSVFGGRVPGGNVIGRSVFEMPVYGNGGNVPERMTVNPTPTAVPATNSAAAAHACGAGPDGLGLFPLRARRRPGFG